MYVQRAKWSHRVLFAILLVGTSGATASVLTVNESQSHLIAIDPQTGAVLPIAAVPALGISSTSTFDAAGRRLFYIAGDGSTSYLVTISLTSGTVTQVPLPDGGLIAEYDAASGAVLVSSGTTLRAINPATGTGPIVAMLPALGIAGGTSTFDAEGRRLFYIAGDGSTIYLVTVLVSTGTVTQVPIASGGVISEYDATTGSVLVDSGAALRAIDPATGNGPIVAALPPLGVSAATTFDPVQRRLFYFGSDGHPVLVTAFVATGTSSTRSIPAAGLFLEHDHGALAIPAVSPHMLILVMCAIGLIGAIRAARF